MLERDFDLFFKLEKLFLLLCGLHIKKIIKKDLVSWVLFFILEL